MSRPAPASSSATMSKHYLEGEVTLGKDNFVSLSYWNNQFWPSLNIGYMRYSYKGHYGYGTDEDGIPRDAGDDRRRPQV